jgi:uncharacterized membrane protein YdbT with pleckstrin-like domain
MAGAQTAKEALLQEILGDALKILDKQEALLKELPKLRAATVQEIKSAEKVSIEALQIAAEKARKDLANERTTVVAEIKSMTESVSRAALVVNRSSKSFKTMVLILAIVGGAIGGMLVSGIVFLTLFPQLLQ